MTIEEDDKNIEKYRSILKKIKIGVLNTNTYSEQNTNALNKVRKQLLQFYQVLEEVVFNNVAVSKIPIQALQKVFYDVLEGYPRSPYYQTRLEYYLKRDFLDYPFTIDEDRINTFGDSQKNPIIPNNIGLTIDDGNIEIKTI